jgi:hypothetical protein
MAGADRDSRLPQMLLGVAGSCNVYKGDASRSKGRALDYASGPCKFTRSATDSNIDVVDGPANAAEPIRAVPLPSTATRLFVSIVPHLR